MPRTPRRSKRLDTSFDRDYFLSLMSQLLDAIGQRKISFSGNQFEFFEIDKRGEAFPKKLVKEAEDQHIALYDMLGISPGDYVPYEYQNIDLIYNTWYQFMEDAHEREQFWFPKKRLNDLFLIRSLLQEEMSKKVVPKNF